MKNALAIKGSNGRTSLPVAPGPKQLISARTRGHDLNAVVRQFQMHGEFICAEPYGSGHINDTYRASFIQGGVPVRYLLQRINHNIFKNPASLMENIQRVTAHLGAKLDGQADFTRRVLTLIPTQDHQ